MTNMKRQYIEPSVRIHRLKVESNLLAGTIGTASGTKIFMFERDIEGLAPEVLGGDYWVPGQMKEEDHGKDKPDFIEGE